ncbi:MAG: sigma-70 family RNA polymerase sigma factor [Gemmatimonadales bacterium]
MSHPSLSLPQAPPLTHASLIPQLRDGDPTALAIVYRRHAPGLLALAFRLTQSVPDAEDIVQDLFVGLPEALRAYREEGRFEAWLRRVVVRLALMRLRRTRRKQEITLDDASLPPAAPFDPSGDVHLSQALERLDAEERTLIVLRVVEGYSHGEIAALLGIRPGAAQVRYHRALTRLKSLVELP